MDSLKLSGPSGPIRAQLQIGGSKSISNRVLLIRALCPSDFEIQNLSDSDDTQCLKNILSDLTKMEYDCHHAGTTFRFLTAYFAFQEKTQILTGSSRMKQRPIGALVDALRSLGANINYLENEGYPPLQILPPSEITSNIVKIKADISSQFISAICMISPLIKDGLKLQFEGELVSKPYVEMTLKVMEYFGVQSQLKDHEIYIPPQVYSPKNYLVESDWSSASYPFAIAAIHNDCQITLHHYFKESLQGDSQVKKIAEDFGVTSHFDENKNCIYLNSSAHFKTNIDYNFIEQPDLAQTFAVVAGAKGITFEMSGLKTLRIKETDRIAALQNELNKVNVQLLPSQKEGSEFKVHGQAQLNYPEFDTYHDHRMAMAFASLSLLGPIVINDPDVITKSYPEFWNDLEKMGFIIQ